jgi:hypothetical protein
MIDWRESLTRQAAAEWQSCQDLQNVQTYISLLDGKYWGDNRPDWRSSFYDNVLADMRIESKAGLTDIHPAMDISCVVDDYKKQADIANNVIRAVYQDQSLDLELADLIDFALLNTGFLKIVAYEPGVMEITSNALGTVIPVTMKGRDLQSSSAVIYRDYEPLGYFYRKFGHRAVGLERQSIGLHATIGDDSYQRPDSIPEYQWRSLSPAMKLRMSLSRKAAVPQRGGYSTEPYPVIPLAEIYHEDYSLNEFGHPVLVKHPDLSVAEHNYHYIVQPKGFMYPRKRLTVFGGDQVVYDGPSPFWDGQYPFCMLSLNPCVWAPGGISKYRDLVPLCRSLNRVGSGVEETVIDAVNRNVVTRRGAIAPIDWDRYDPSKPKQKLMLNGNANVSQDFKYMEAKQLPAYVEMWLKHLDQRIKSRSGALDIQGLMSKKQVSGGDAIEGMRDAKSGPYRLESRYVEELIVKAATMMVSRIFQFYTVDQRLRLLGPDGQTWEDYDYQASSMVPAFSPAWDHWKLFSVRAKQGSMHGNSTYKKQVAAITLLKMGKMSLETAYSILDIGVDGSQEISKIVKESKELPQPAPKKGQGRDPRQTRGQRTGNPI